MSQCQQKHEGYREGRGGCKYCAVFVDPHLDWVLAGEEVDDLTGVTHDADSKHLLTVVAAW